MRRLALLAAASTVLAAGYLLVNLLAAIDPNRLAATPHQTADLQARINQPTDGRQAPP